MKTTLHRIFHQAVLTGALVAVLASARAQVATPFTPPVVDSKKSLLYTIAVTDVLLCVVFGEDELRISPRVDAKGCVNLPLVQEVKVHGLTLREAEQVIANAYRDGRFLRNPQVSLSVTDYARREVSISGQVKSPGVIALPPEATMTVLDAINRANGFTDTAKGEAVRVTRVYPNGTKEIFVVDVDGLMKGKTKAKSEDNSLLLQPGDIIYVPERLI